MLKRIQRFAASLWQRVILRSDPESTKYLPLDNDNSEPHAELRCPESSGPIMAEEKLALGLYSPEVFDPQTGKVTVAAIKIDTLIEKNGHVDICGESTGISVARIEKPEGAEELQRTLIQIMENRKSNNKQGKIEGHATITVKELLEIEEGAFQILDDGCNGYTTHAVIRAAEKMGRAAMRGPRNRLLEHLNKTVVRV